MCQFIIEKTGKKCSFKAEPYCHIHGPKQQQIVDMLNKKIEYLEYELSKKNAPIIEKDNRENNLRKENVELILRLAEKDMEINNMKKLMVNSYHTIPEECNICYETRIKFISHITCKNKICIDCIIKSGKMICPYCRGDLSSSLDNESISLIKYIENKDKIILSLKHEIMAQRLALRLNNIE